MLAFLLAGVRRARTAYTHAFFPRRLQPALVTFETHDVFSRATRCSRLPSATITGIVRRCIGVCENFHAAAIAPDRLSQRPRADSPLNIPPTQPLSRSSETLGWRAGGREGRGAEYKPRTGMVVFDRQFFAPCRLFGEWALTLSSYGGPPIREDEILKVVASRTLHYAAPVASFLIFFDLETWWSTPPSSISCQKLTRNG